MIPRLKPRLGLRELISLFLPAKNSAVIDFEQNFANQMQHKYAIAFPYGRTGLKFLLQALAISNKEIICPAYTCVVVPHAIVLSNNKPIFVDSNQLDFNMDLQQIENKITHNTAAIIATSIFGYPINLDFLKRIKEKHPHIHIIQDCAHSFSAQWNKQPVQTAGVAAIYGLNISKLITSIFGGMITTDDDQIAAELVKLRDTQLSNIRFSKSIYRRLYLMAIYFAFNNQIYGFINWLERNGFLNHFVKYYDESKLTMPKDYLDKLSNIEATIGKIQLTKYDSIIATRSECVKYYNQELQNIVGLRLPPIIEGATYSHYVPQVANRKELLAYALANGVQLGQLIEYSIPEMQYYKQYANNDIYPVAHSLSQSTINLPIYNAKLCHKVSIVLKRYFAEHASHARPVCKTES